MDHQHSKVERFLKLGYSHGDILRVLENLRHDAQTNDILEELIKTCHSRSTSNNRATPASSASSPQLVPRGCSSPQPSAAPNQPLQPSPDRDPTAGFRPVVIDGSNVAMSHGDKRVFSCRGLQLAVKWFLDRGVRDITVFVPLWRKEQPRPEAPITDQHILHDLERRKILVYTPSRCVNGKRVVCYDDRYIIKLAFDSDGIIVSNDNYRDLQTEKPLWKKFIEERLLMYSFVNDKFMPPDDPLGRNGPTIDNFLRKKSRALDGKQQHCPYGKKCTYGVKCKFYHPERANQSQLSVADELRAMSRPVVDREQLFVLPPAQALSHRVSLDSHPYSAPNLFHDLESPSLSHRYPSTPLPSRNEEQSHRTSPNEQFISQRDTGSPALLPNTSLRLCPSPDTDEAFGSLDSSMYRLQIRDMSKSTERLSYAYSSGVGGCGQGSGDLYLSGSYNTNALQRLSVGGGPYAPQRSPLCGCDKSQTCEHSACNQCRHGPQHTWSRPPPGGSYGAQIPNGGDSHIHLSDQQCLQRPLPYRQGNSLPEYHWGQGDHSDGELTSRAKTHSSEQRRNLRSQLSTLYPQSMVERVMCLYPHVMDMSELLPLIQRYRNSQVSF